MSGQPGQLRLTGLHHVTAIARDLARTEEFYVDVLGLTLVERESNVDDPDARHFWFGDAAGTAGTLISFLEYAELPDGRSGPGTLHHVSFSVGSSAELEAWVDWLRSQGVECTDALDRGRLRSVYVRDPDGLIVELAAPV